MEEKELGKDAKAALTKMGELMKTTNDSYKQLLNINDYLNSTLKVYIKVVTDLVNAPMESEADQEKINAILRDWSDGLADVKPQEAPDAAE